MPKPDETPAGLSSERVYFANDLYKHRYNVARETFWRWLKDGRFPPADVRVAGRPAWTADTIRAHESAAA